MNLDDLREIAKVKMSVGVSTTCSGGGLVVFRTYEDPETKEMWNERVCDMPSTLVRDETVRPNHALTHADDPSAFKGDERHAEVVQLAHAIASLPELLSIAIAIYENPAKFGPRSSIFKKAEDVLAKARIDPTLYHHYRDPEAV